MSLIKAARPFNLGMKKKVPLTQTSFKFVTGGVQEGDNAAISVPTCMRIGRTLLPHLKCEITPVLVGLTLMNQLTEFDARGLFPTAEWLPFVHLVCRFWLGYLSFLAARLTCGDCVRLMNTKFLKRWGSIRQSHAGRQAKAKWL